MAGSDATADIHLETTLPGASYCDPAVLEREWERIFNRSWICAGREERAAVPGQYFTLAVGQESVLVVRDREARLRAFYNVCRHRGARLCPAEEGQLKGAVSCAYHAWTYSLDGRLIGTPHLSGGEAFPRQDFSLVPVALETWGGFIFINLEGERAAPLALHLGAAPERLKRYPLASLKSASRQTHEAECNWKILVENYQECYHCPGVHPELCDLVPLYRKGIVDASDSDLVAYFREGAATFTRSGTTRRPFLTGLNDAEKRKYDGELIVPTMMLNLFPDYVQYRVLWPLAPGRTRIVTEWLFEASTMAREDFDPRDAIEFINLIGRQDWDVCELVQKGVGSRAHRHGVYTPQETHSRAFKTWYLDRFENGPAPGPQRPADR